MAKKSVYNERFGFKDPGSSHFASRSTLYRNRKKRKVDLQENSQIQVASGTRSSDEDIPYDIEETSLNSDVHQKTVDLDTSYETVLDAEVAGHLDCQRDLIDEDGGIEVPLHSTSETAVYLDTSYETDYINPAVLEAEVAGHLDCQRDIDEDGETEIPLHSTSAISLEGSNVAIMHYKMRHNLTDEAISDLLGLLSLHNDSGHSSSLHHFKKFFKEAKLKTISHYYCTLCLKESSESERKCQNSLCESDFSSAENKSCFTEVPIGGQIQALFKRELKLLIRTCCL